MFIMTLLTTASFGQLQVTWPNTSVSLWVSHSETITWNTGSIPGYVKILLNREYDNGGRWEQIVSSTLNDGEFDWTIRGGGGTHCRIAIRSLWTGEQDISDADFTISVPTIEVTSPTAGENLWVSHTDTIAWVAANLEGNVQINLYHTLPDSLFPLDTIWVETLFDSTENDGFELWNITGYPSDSCWIEIKSDHLCWISDTTGYFQINAPEIVVIYPNGGEEIMAYNDTTYIRWSAPNLNDDVYIKLNRNNGFGTWETIFLQTPNTGSVNWVPTGNPSDQCLISIQACNFWWINDTSDAVFSILNPIEVTSPNGSEVWNVGEIHNITWNHSTLVGVTDTVKILLTRNFSSPAPFWETLTDFYIDSVGICSYSWEITGQGSTDCRIKVMAWSNAGIQDISNDEFTITAPSVTVTYPSISEITWTIGEIETILWDYANSFGNVSVKINYNYPSGPWLSLYENIPNDGSVDWIVEGPASTTCRIKVNYTALPQYSDISDNNFAIVEPEDGGTIAGEENPLAVEELLPTDLTLSSSPNPFNASTTIHYGLPDAGNVHISVYDITGRLTAELVDEYFPAGMHSVAFEGNNLSTGIYFCALEFEGKVLINKLVMIK